VSSTPAERACDAVPCAVGLDGFGAALASMLIEPVRATGDGGRAVIDDLRPVFLDHGELGGAVGCRDKFAAYAGAYRPDDDERSRLRRSCCGPQSSW
jgi:hypothetical protein